MGRGSIAPPKATRLMGFSVKEIYFTLQGEGAQTGRAAVFFRFAGCNLWTGREQDRHKASCTFCDTDFVGTDGPGGGRFSDEASAVSAILDAWPDTGTSTPPYVVFTGGEPLLQLTPELVAACKTAGIEVAIETNGTLPAPDRIDWICVSPKPGKGMKQTTGDELKLVFPQPQCPPTDFEHLDFTHFFLQPMDGPDQQQNIQRAAEYCQAHPKWRLSLQTHKLIGLP